MKKTVVVCLAVLLCSCSLTDEYAAQHKMRELVMQNQLDAAMTVAQSTDFYSDEESSFVENVDLGTLHYLKGEYYQALQYFDKAAKRNKELYTTSVSKTVLSQVAGEALADYAGERYEASMIRFYQSLCHYHLAHNGVYEAYDKTDDDGNVVHVPEKKLSDQEKRLHENGARAGVVDWNGLLVTYTAERSGAPIYKQDLLAKVWGGFIHENHGTTADKQISKQLYRDVSRYLTRNYNLYPAFNGKWEEYGKNYKKLPTLPEKTVKSTYVSETPYAKTLLAASTDAEKALNGKKNNVRVFMKTGLIGEREIDTTRVDLGMAALIGVFADDPAFVTMMLTSPDVEISIPKIACHGTDAEYFLNIKNAAGKRVVHKRMALVNPMTEIACRDYQEALPAYLTAKAARMTTKYTTALLAAYTTYQATKSSSEALGQLAAAGTFAASVAAINASEKPDLRYWSLLPDNVWFQGVSLPKGKYTLDIVKGETTVYSDALNVPAKGFVLADINLPAE